MDIAFLITTHNRPFACQRLVDSLQGIGHIVVINDGSEYIINGCEQHFYRPHMGKRGYYLVVNSLWQLRGFHKYYIMLPDDFLMNGTQVNEAIKIWENIKDNNKICLNLYTDRIGQSCWTNFTPIDKGKVWQTQWVDMCFLCEDAFFSAVPRIDIPYATHGKRQSSGVGAFVSSRLHRRGYHLYQVKDSLVDIQEEHYKSQMHESSGDGQPSRPRRRGIKIRRKYHKPGR